MIEAGNFTIDMKTINDEDLEGEKKANLESELSNYMQESINMVGAASPAPVVEIGEKT